MTDAELVRKKLAFILQCVRELETLPDPARIATDIREERFVVHTLQLAIQAARAERRHRRLHAFPAADNAPSNAICRRLGFTLVEELPFEYPPGRWMRCNDWRLDLLPAPGQ